MPAFDSQLNDLSYIYYEKYHFDGVGVQRMFKKP